LEEGDLRDNSVHVLAGYWKTLREEEKAGKN
jgi:hypothetical protein